MIDVTLPNPPADVLGHLREFGADWRESKIPPDLRRRGILGVGVAITANQFTMTIRAARRSPEFRMLGSVVATPDGGSRIIGTLRLSRANQLMAIGGVALIGVIFVYSFEVVTAIIAWIVLISAIAVMSAAGRTIGEREYRILLEHATPS